MPPTAASHGVKCRALLPGLSQEATEHRGAERGEAASLVHGGAPATKGQTQARRAPIQHQPMRVMQAREEDDAPQR